jgi:hypothetical protein
MHMNNQVFHKLLCSEAQMAFDVPETFYASRFMLGTESPFLAFITYESLVLASVRVGDRTQSTESCLKKVVAVGVDEGQNHEWLRVKLPDRVRTSFLRRKCKL